MGGGGGGGGDGGAKELRKQEAEKQAKIAAATAKVNEVFAPYNDSYYSKGLEDYRSYYAPQAEKQYNDARRQMAYSLNDRGLSQSSEAGKELADLNDEYAQQKLSIENGANDFIRGWRSNVEQTRGNLLSQAQLGPEASQIAAQAATAAKASTQQPSFSPIGDLFGKLTSNYANYALLSQSQANNSAARYANGGSGGISNSLLTINGGR